MILDKIRAALAGMQGTNRRIAAYVLENDQSVGFASIHDVSKAVGVSNASLLRFARSLGMKGYSELKRSIQEELKHRLSPHDKIALSELDILPKERQLKELFGNEIRNLERTLSGVDVEDVLKLVEGVASSERVFLSGFGVSQHIIKILEYSLVSTLDKPVVTITGSVSDYAPKLRSFGPRDALYVITFPIYSREVTHVARYAKKRGGRIFLFTDSARCPIYDLADTVIRCENNSLIMANSYVGLIAVQQAFINMLRLSDKAGSAESMQGLLDLEGQGYEDLGMGEGR